MEQNLEYRTCGNRDDIESAIVEGRRLETKGHDLSHIIGLYEKIQKLEGSYAERVVDLIRQTHELDSEIQSCSNLINQGDLIGYSTKISDLKEMVFDSTINPTTERFLHTMGYIGSAVIPLALISSMWFGEEGIQKSLRDLAFYMTNIGYGVVSSLIWGRSFGDGLIERKRKKKERLVKEIRGLSEEDSWIMGGISDVVTESERLYEILEKLKNDLNLQDSCSNIVPELGIEQIISVQNKLKANIGLCEEIIKEKEPLIRSYTEYQQRIESLSVEEMLKLERNLDSLYLSVIGRSF